MTDTRGVSGDRAHRRGELRLVPDAPQDGAPDGTVSRASRPGRDGSSAGPGEPPFEITVEPLRETVRIAVTGEIDIATAPAVGAELAQMIDAGFRRVVLDLRDVRFMDSTGIRAILTAHWRAQERDVTFRLIAVDGPVKRIFDVAGLSSILAFVSARQIDESPI